MKQDSKSPMEFKKPLKSFITDWHHSEGVFETSRGKFIARVTHKMRNNALGYKTLSQHETREEAQRVYDNYKKSTNQ